MVPGYTANYVEIADFKNLMSEDGGADYFSAGITEALRSQLADIRDVYILEADKGIRGPVRLEGSVQKVGESLRIAYRLFRRKDNVQIAGGKLDGAYKDIFILQDRVVAEIAGYLANEFKLENFRPAALNLTSDVTSYDYYLRGLEYLKLPETNENYDSAIKYMTTALVHDSGFAGANAGICRAYHGKYNISREHDLLAKAEEYCGLAISQDDSLADVHVALALIYRDTGRSDEALKILERITDIDDKHLDAQVAMASIYKSKNEIEKAEQTFLSAINDYPDHWMSHSNYASFLMSIGRSQESIGILKRALELTPENEFALNNLGVSYFYIGEYSKAAGAFAAAVAISPTGAGYSNTGTVYFFAANYAKAAEMFRKGVRLAPDDYRLYSNLADALRQLPGKKDSASQQYWKTINLAKKQLQVNRDDYRAHQYIAMSYLFLGDFENAASHMEMAIKLNPDDVEVIYAHVRFLTVTKKIEEALIAMKKLLETGYSRDLLSLDPDIEELRKHPEYSAF